MHPEDLSSSFLPYHLFEPDADLHIVERRLPHWSQPGAVAFITWRLHDSMPTEVIQRWREERARWLLDHGINMCRPDWRTRLNSLDPQLRHSFVNSLSNRWHDALDAGHGSCILRNTALAEIVAQSLGFFDGKRYVLMDFVVMPNHVHLLAAFPDEKSMLNQCESWKHYTAVQINRRLKRKDRLWQQDAFDHLVRTEEQLKYLRQYIAENPAKAHLRPGEFVHYSSMTK